MPYCSTLSREEVLILYLKAIELSDAVMIINVYVYNQHARHALSDSAV